MKTKLSNSWHSYPNIFAVGHTYISSIFEDKVLIEEKIDGSQFSFGIIEGELKCKSKGATINVQYPEKMFSKAVEVVKSLDLHPEWTYRSEFLSQPKHNSLAYDRTPINNLIIFDINDGHESYLNYENKKSEAQRIGLECVPVLMNDKVNNPDELIKLLETKSVLGGQNIEGFVVKNYFKFVKDKTMMGKYVSEHFKEVHGKEWKSSNPSSLGIIEELVKKYKTEARWDKSIIHLKEQGKLEGIPEDIGILLKEINEDILKECEEDIKQELFDWAWNKIRRGTCSGFPEYYKEKIMKDSFK